jgi:heptosyltransferase III
MTRILFITATRLGDAVLTTGVLDYLLRTCSDPRVTIVCGELPAPLFAGVPGLERVVILRKESWNRHWVRLWRDVVRTKWDVVVDMRNSAVSRMIRCDRRYIYQKGKFGSDHMVCQFGRMLGQGVPPSPRLWFTPDQDLFAHILIPNGIKVLGVGPTSNWQGKTWAPDRFIDLIRWMTSSAGPMNGARVAVFAAPGEEQMAYQVLRTVAIDRQIDVIAKGDTGQVAAALSRCSMYIGNDSGLMHTAAAAGIPTLGLFGPSHIDTHYPWGPQCMTASTPQTYAQLIDYPDYNSKTAPCLMTSLTLDSVKEKVVELLDRVKSSPYSGN